MTPIGYILAARVPRSLPPQEFGLWQIERIAADGAAINPREKSMGALMVGFPDYTLLRRFTCANIHLAHGEIVMEDSVIELSRHLPIWMAARGRVLVTGLGLGCVVRGLLANPMVRRIDVVEIDPDIVRVIGPEFAADPRVMIHLGDALKIRWSPDTRFDFAWHDLWKEGRGLQLMHAELIIRLRGIAGRQGAWAFPRTFAKLWARKGHQLLGAPAR